MGKLWEQVLLIALAYCVGLFSPYVRDIQIAGAGKPLWESLLFILTGLIMIGLVVICVGILLKRIYDKCDKEEKENKKKEEERDKKLDRIVTALEHLVRRMEDGGID